MPRVTNPPRATPQKNSGLKIPLNDDRQEKAVRLQSRVALHDLQMNQLKAAATPVRKLNQYTRAASSSPRTPQNSRNRGKENIEDGGLLAVVPGNSMTPMKRVPLLANFEEWMKMATDNKINASNSWNFALIDYFHDMSLLKEGDGVNFQKASCTLDGCVKIYTSRVDSVATETGKLLSGLADSGSKKQKRGEDEQEGDSGDEEDGGEGAQKRVKKRTQRTSESTMASSFAQLQLKKFELEFSVDPLFKKASADFDEGGAKGLLLNHLTIDSQGRIIFDSSDDVEQAAMEPFDPNSSSSKLEEAILDGGTGNGTEPGIDLDIDALRSRFFPDLTILDDQHICPSMESFDLGNPSVALNIPLLKPVDDADADVDAGPGANLSGESGIFLDDESANGFDDDNDPGTSDFVAGAGFGDGGELWARSAALETQTAPPDEGFDDAEQYGDTLQQGTFNVDGNHHQVALDQGLDHENVLSYFDSALRKDWAGPEYWRIRKMKDHSKPTTLTQPKRKEKEPFIIDFASPLDAVTAESIYTGAASHSAITLPKAQWKSKQRNLLPDDKHFNSKDLLGFFLKPRARLSTLKKSKISGPSQPLNQPLDGEVDEAFWAQQGGQADEAPPLSDRRADYNADFFQDDGPPFVGGLEPDDDDFADAREAFSPGLDGDMNAPSLDALGSSARPGEGEQPLGFGAQLVTQTSRLRPEYVQYAKVAKKVDVRQLKEDIWKGMEMNAFSDESPPIEVENAPAPESLRFTTVMKGLQQVYPRQALADISTSYCFICLLHLANEKGLALNNEEGLTELGIRKDLTADLTDSYA